jgi:hypothetical protein
VTGPLALGAAIGDCVHVTGVLNFLAACRRHGYRTEFLGPAVAVKRVAEEAAERSPELLALSYRLTPEAAERLFAELAAALHRHGITGMRAVFGGTPPVVEVARRSGLFAAAFGAPDGPGVEEWLLGHAEPAIGDAVADRDLISRWRRRQPRPLIRHHFGLPTLGWAARNDGGSAGGAAAGATSRSSPGRRRRRRLRARRGPAAIPRLRARRGLRTPPRTGPTSGPPPPPGEFPRTPPACR